VVGRNPDFVALAQACGASGTRIRDAASLEAELASALARPGPTLLEIKASDFRSPQ